jgi:hypothetical protein
MARKVKDISHEHKSPFVKPDNAGDWDAFARNIASGMSIRHAYAAAYPNSKLESAGASATKLLRHPYVQRRLWELGQKAEVKPVEVLRTLRDQMMADIGDVFQEDGSIDFAELIANGKSRLIKKVKFDKDSGKIVEIEAYSSQAAAVALLKVCGLEQAPRANDADRELLEKQVNKVMETMDLTREQAELWLKDNVPAAAKYIN